MTTRAAIVAEGIDIAMGNIDESYFDAMHDQDWRAQEAYSLHKFNRQSTERKGFE